MLDRMDTSHYKLGQRVALANVAMLKTAGTLKAGTEGTIVHIDGGTVWVATGDQIVRLDHSGHIHEL